MTDDERWMRAALAAADEARAAGEVPVGALLVRGEDVVGRTGNRTLRDQDPTAHAECLAIRDAAAALRSWRLDGCTLYVTLEPCAMCAGAIVLARVPRVVYGTTDPKAGAVGSVFDILHEPRLNHRPDVAGGLLAEEAGDLLRSFFAARR